MLVKASKELEVAEVTKQTEQKQLDIIKIKADQQVAQAEAKRVAIEKSGAITELQSAEIELQRQIAEYKWKAIGQGIASVKLPSVLTLGTGDGKIGINPLDNLINTLIIEKLGNLTTIKPQLLNKK